MRKNCSSVRKKNWEKSLQFEAFRPRICNVFEIFFLTQEQCFPQLVRNIMVTDYFFVYSFFSSVRKKIEKNFWDIEILGNRRKNKIVVNWKGSMKTYHLRLNQLYNKHGEKIKINVDTPCWYSRQQACSFIIFFLLQKRFN